MRQNWLLNRGAVYVCCWGTDCERVHDAIDTAAIARNPSCDPVVMTTWHDEEPLAKAVFFALNCTSPDDGYAEGCDALLAVFIGNAAGADTVRAAFADPVGFIGRFCQ